MSRHTTQVISVVFVDLIESKSMYVRTYVVHPSHYTFFTSIQMSWTDGATGLPVGQN